MLKTKYNSSREVVFKVGFKFGLLCKSAARAAATEEILFNVCCWFLVVTEFRSKFRGTVDIWV